MARIPEAELERIKREIRLVDLVRARGIELKKHGKDLAGLCCFHDDHSPSLIVDPQQNVFHCFGCGAKGSVVDWVMKTEGVSFRHAVELLRTDQPVSGNGSKPVKASRVKRSTVTKLPVPFDQEASDQELLNRVAEYYHESLLESLEAQQYLESRGLDHPDLISHFRLGFSNRTLGYRLPNKQRAAGAAIRGRLQDLGIYRDTGHEHLSGCVVFPVFDAAGNVAELYGRKITRQLKKGIPLHLYLPGPHRGVWNAVGLEGSKEVILCESLIDALSFWCAEFRNVTAAYGTNGFTDEHVETFQCLGIERVLIAYDRDEAGERGAEAVAERLEPLGIACSRIQFPKGLDANEYACKVQPSKKSLGLAIRHAIPMREGLPPKAATSPSAKPSQSIPSLPTPSLVASSSGSSTEAPIAPPEPPRPQVPVNAEISDSEVVIALGDRRYRVRGLARNTSYDSLRVNLLLTRGESMHVDTLDLHLARQRTAYIKQAAEEIQLKPEVLKKDLAKVFLKLEELQDEQIKRTLAPEEQPVVLSDEQTKEALDLLRDPRLLERLLEDFERCGVVGEETNKLVGYLAALSRKLEEPLAVMIQSSSAAGKSSLMDAILAFVPEEERVQYSAMTGQSLFYMGETDLKHKVLAIVEEEGAERASYALKLLQSEGELSIASTGKDPQSGRLLTHEYRVEGPVMIFLTTTAIEIDEELLNRCLVLSVDEEREQTRAIHRLQREQQTLEGLLAKQDRTAVLELHKNAQRLLCPLLVANPFAKELTFLDTRTRTRRDHGKYLTLIRTIALLHQHQRSKKTIEHRGQTVEYIEVELADVETANRLAHEVLGRSLDELSPQTRRMLLLTCEMVREVCKEQGIDREDCHFTRRSVREHSGWTDFQVRTHLRKLEQLEYVLVHRGGRGQSFVYELLYDGEGQEGQPFLMGLIEPPTLRCHGYDSDPEHPNSDSEHRNGKNEPPASPQSAPNEHPSRSTETADEASSDKDLLAFDPKEPGKALKGSSEKEVVRKRRSSTKATS